MSTKPESSSYEDYMNSNPDEYGVLYSDPEEEYGK